MANRIDFENGRISNFQCHMTLTLTLDRAIWYTIVHRLSSSTYIPNFIRIGETFLHGRKYVRMEGRTDIEAGFIRSSRPNKLIREFQAAGSATVNAPPASLVLVLTSVKLLAIPDTDSRSVSGWVA